MTEFETRFLDLTATPDGKVMFIVGVIVVAYIGWNAFAVIGNYAAKGLGIVKYNMAAYNADLAMDKYAHLKAHGGTPHQIRAAKDQHMRLVNAREGRHFA